MRFRAPILALALCSIGCASAQKNAYIAASVTKQTATEAHQIWSEQLNIRVDECDPEKNSKITTEAQFDECLGPYASNDDIVIALEIYTKAAESLFVILKSPNPDKAALSELRRRVIDAAWDLLEKMPDDKFGGIKKQLESIVGR